MEIARHTTVGRAPVVWCPNPRLKLGKRTHPLNGFYAPSKKTTWPIPLIPANLDSAVPSSIPVASGDLYRRDCTDR